MQEGSLEELAAEKDPESRYSSLENIYPQESSEFIPATWLYLLRRLTDLITNTTHEVRNGAVHTALRIFDNHGDDFSPKTWQLLLDTILLRMIDSDISTYREICSSDVSIYGEEQSEFIKAKMGTSKILLADSSKLIADYLEPMSRAANFNSIWSHLMRSLTEYLSFNLHELIGSAFTALNVIMSKASQSKLLDASAVETASAVWDDNFPSPESKLRVGSNLEAYEAYVTSLKAIYKFRRDKITAAETEQIVQNLERCVRESESPSYSSDLDSLTQLHTQVISCVSELRTDLKGVTSIVLGMLARFIGMPLATERKGGLTYIALSKSSMGLVGKLINKDSPWQELLHSTALPLLLKNLEESIQLKYKRTKQGRNPPLWKKATTTAIIVLEQTLPRVFDHKLLPASLRSFWDTTVAISHNITHADVESLVDGGTAHISFDTFAEDEKFDGEALAKLNSLVVPALGDAAISDSTRRKYARSLFTASLVHHRHDPDSTEDNDDLPLRLNSEPLADLYVIRPGRTYDVPPVVREHMAYTCSRTLLELLRSRSDDETSKNSEVGENYVRLAKAAAPYVILRAALPLRTYIADQPLRGKMPMPESQVHELATVLKELGELRCEKKAIPATAGVESSEGGQLVRLYPLIVKAAGVRNGPIEVKRVTQSWLVRLGDELDVG
jgi:C-terminal region of Mon2 protein